MLTRLKENHLEVKLIYAQLHSNLCTESYNLVTVYSTFRSIVEFAIKLPLKTEDFRMNNPG